MHPSSTKLQAQDFQTPQTFNAHIVHNMKSLNTKPCTFMDSWQETLAFAYQIL